MHVGKHIFILYIERKVHIDIAMNFFLLVHASKDLFF